MNSTESYLQYFSKLASLQGDRYINFRQQHPFRSQKIGDFEWPYIDTNPSGVDTIPLLILVGGLRVADAAFQSISMLERDHHIIAPTYPPLYTMRELADGLAGLMDSLDIDNVDILSGSFGGLVAQVFVERHQDRVRKLILSSTGVMTEKAIRNRKKMLRTLRWMPAWGVRKITERRLFTIIDPPEDEAAFWRVFLKELFNNRLGKADIISTIACMIDFGENFSLSAENRHETKADVLIIASEDDQTFQPDAHLHLLKLYPNAAVHLFTDAGHSPAKSQSDVYFGRVREFLQQ